MNKKRPFVVVLLIAVACVIFLRCWLTVESKIRTIGFIASAILFFFALIILAIKQDNK